MDKYLCTYFQYISQNAFGGVPDMLVANKFIEFGRVGIGKKSQITLTDGGDGSYCVRTSLSFGLMYL